MVGIKIYIVGAGIARPFFSVFSAASDRADAKSYGHSLNAPLKKWNIFSSLPSNKQTKKTKEAADMKKNIPTVLAVIAALAIAVIALGATDGDAAR